MPIIIGIDGTGGQVSPGAGRSHAYDHDFAHSFVRRICLGRGPNAQYNRGPAVLGGGLDDAYMTGKNFIATRRSIVGTGEPILLTGFSRGGLGVLMIARDLQIQNIPVEAMLLFDAIDMYAFGSVETVPTNVRNVYHARSRADANSRRNWRKKDCGGNPHNPQVHYTERAFRCTHGAMGGTPQKDPSHPNAFVTELGSGLMGIGTSTTNVTNRDNPIISEQVWAAVQPFIQTHHFM